MQGNGDQQQAKNDFSNGHKGLSFTEISMARQMEGRAARLRNQGSYTGEVLHAGRGIFWRKSALA
jgi:hypothetical protein